MEPGGTFRHHELWTAALDLRLSPSDSLIFVTTKPHRWDELLDTHLPTLISSRVANWETLASELWEAGCPSVPMRLIEPSGAVTELGWEQHRLEPTPSSNSWVLALGWTHPEEGWRARLPLAGRRYLVTRSAEQGGALVERLRKLGAQAYAVPTIAFTDPDDFHPWVRAVKEIGTFDWVLFTSPNGVDFFIERLCQSGLDLRSLAKAKFACIGPSTAKTLAKHNLKADLIPGEYVAEGLFEALKAELGEPLKGLKFLLPRAQVARAVLPEALTAAGAEVLVAPVYKTVAPDLAELPQEKATLLFTSSSTVSNWVTTTSGSGPNSKAPCYCIGPITAQTAREYGLEVLGVADPYTVDGLVELLLKDMALSKTDKPTLNL